MTLSQRQRMLAAFVLGLIAALGQAPFDLPAVMLGAMAGAAYVIRDVRNVRRVAFLGWLFGAGYFAVSLHWIVSPFLVDAPRHGWMAPFALVLLAGGIALFWGAAFGLSRWFSQRAWPLILCWPAAEMARAYVFTGFPWANPVQGTVDVLFGQILAISGPYGAMLMLVACAVALASHGAWVARAALAIGAGAALLIGPLAGPAQLTGQIVRLVQPNAPQEDKWNPELIPVFFNRQLTATAQPSVLPPSMIVWPETAIPWSLEWAGSVLAQISDAAADTPVLLGVQRSDAGRYYNALIRLGAKGEVADIYDKHHLVPFGEYIPFGGLLGLVGLADRLGSGYSAGPGARLIDVPGIGKVLPLICYEAVFAHDVNAAPGRAALIVHVTNDAWFGKAAGPLQHLSQARMRAIEQGLPVARAANTGVSAMIDPYGRVLDALSLGVSGYIDAPLPAPLPHTFYARTKDAPLAALFLASLVIMTIRRRKRITR